MDVLNTFINRLRPGKSLVKSVAAGMLPEAYMGLDERAIFLAYHAMNFDEFLAFSAGAYQMKLSRPTRVDELLLRRSLTEYVNTAHQQYMPNGKYALDLVKANEARIASSARDYSTDMVHAQKLAVLNSLSAIPLDTRLGIMESFWPDAVSSLFSQLNEEPKKIRYVSLERDRFRRNQGPDDFYAQEIARRFDFVKRSLSEK